MNSKKSNSDVDLQDAEHDLVDQLQRLESDRRRNAAQPDWQSLQRAINEAVAAQPVPSKPWWRRWLIPTMAMATAAAIAIWMNVGSVATVANVQPVAAALQDAAHAAPLVALIPSVDESIELSAEQLLLADDRDDFALDDDGGKLHRYQDQAALLGEYDIRADETDSDVTLGPDTGLHWVDNMDEQGLDDLEKWLSQELAKRQVKKG